MKTEAQVQSEIDDINSKYAEQYRFDKKELDKARKELNFLGRCLKYLKSDCEKEPYLKKEMDVLEKRLILVDDGFGKWCSSNADIAYKYENPLPVYHRHMGRAKIVKQIATIKYLIS